MAKLIDGKAIAKAIREEIAVETAAFKEKKNDVPKEAPVQTPAPKEEKRISPGVMAEVPEASDADKDGDLIAAISAVITCATGHSDFKIKSIKKG